MTTYKDIRGTHIKTVTTDPPAPVNGQMWYNSTTQVMKGFTSSPAGSWASGGDLNTARRRFTGTGTQTSALGFGGGPPATGVTESYNGTSFTEVADLNTARRELAASGASNTSALAFGGFKSPPDTTYANTENWDGSSWTEVADLNSGRFQLAGSGTNTAALAFGGYIIPNTSDLTELWNGSSWTETADLNSTRRLLFGDGTSTSALAVGGWPPAKALTESWNGSAWTETGDLNTARYAAGAALTDSTAGLVYGGHNGSAEVAVTEEWNGSSWTEVADISTARAYVAQAGTGATSALVFGGQLPGSPAVSAATEEFTAPTTSTVTFTAS